MFSLDMPGRFKSGSIVNIKIKALNSRGKIIDVKKLPVRASYDMACG